MKKKAKKIPAWEIPEPWSKIHNFEEMWYIPPGWTRKALFILTGPESPKTSNMIERIRRDSCLQSRDVAYYTAIRVERPAMELMKEARPMLLGFLKRYKPVTVLCMGVFALKTLTAKGTMGVTEWRRKDIPVTLPYKPKRIRTTYAPVGTLKPGGYHLRGKIRADIDTMIKPEKKLAPPKRGMPRSVKLLGIDSEFDGPEALVTFGVADARNAIALEGKDMKKCWKLVRRAKRIAGHSVPGDLDFIVREMCK